MTVQFETLKSAEDVEFDIHPSIPPQSLRTYQRFIKPALDTLFILIALPIVLPVSVLIAVALMAQGQSPFFVQERVGKDGRIFRMWKFRTMVDDAEKVLAGYLQDHPEAGVEWARHQKLKHDPRITPIGRLLRKTSLDELPQLWNVLKGDMALVGPRPMMPQQQVLYSGTAYYWMRPGITGYWQISDRNECEFRARAKHDTVYGSEMSLMTDIGVLARTVGVVLRGTGY